MINSNGQTTVVVAHFNGFPSYLASCLRKASLNNSVVFIGDSSNKGRWSSFWNSDEHELARFSSFLKVYKKLSNYTLQYEQSFWRRVFAVEKWLFTTTNPDFILIDSDVLLFSNLETELLPRVRDKCISALMTPEDQDDFRWASSCHVSYWTREGIKSFTDFCLESYTDEYILPMLEEKWAWHRKNNIAGGVCEMTLLYLWQQRHADKVDNLSKVINMTTFDHNINTSTNNVNSEYNTVDGIKQIKFSRGSPFVFNKIYCIDVRFLAIHCQGGSKVVISILANPLLCHYYMSVLLLRNALKRLKSIAVKMSKLLRFK
jgi:hypothetical protein